MFALLVRTLSTGTAQVGISVTFGPPPLPIYEQSPCPGDGYIWIPGRWGWDSEIDDYWVPSTWASAPEVGFLWTPSHRSWEEGAFVFHEGYWGPHVDFNGDDVHSFGYFVLGFVGGSRDVGQFIYNRSVTNISILNGHSVYNETVINRRETRVLLQAA